MTSPSLQVVPTNSETLGLVGLLLLITILPLVLHPTHILFRRFAELLLVSTVAVAAKDLPHSSQGVAFAIKISALGLQPLVFINFCRDFAAYQVTGSKARSVVSGWFIRATTLGALFLAVAVMAARFTHNPAFLVARGGLFAADLLGLGIGLALLARASFRSNTALARWTLAIAWIGAALAFLPPLVAAIIARMLRAPALVTNHQAAALLFALPISVALALASSPSSYRAGFARIIDRVSAYVLLAISLLLIYAAIVMTAGRLLDAHFSLLSESLTLGLAAVAALTYAPLRARLQRRIDILLYDDYYELGPTLQHFSQELAELRDIEGVVNLLLNGLVETLNLTGIAFVALPEGLDQRILRLIEAEDLRARREYATREGRTAVLQGLASLDLTTHRLSWKRPLLLDPWPGCAAVVLVGPATGGEGLGLLVVGPKRAASRLHRDDRTLLVTLSHQAATALSNALLVSGLYTSLAQVRISTAQLVAARAEQQLLLRELVTADERQRAALARDLHDDALQEVLYLIRHSRLCTKLAEDLAHLSHSETLASYPAKAEHNDSKLAPLDRLRQELVQLSERSIVVEQRLRALYMGLYPALLDSLGLAAALDDLAKELSTSTGLPITVHYGEDAVEAASLLDQESALHVYRIAQEALRNAAKHAGAPSAEVWLTTGTESLESASLHSVIYRTLRLEIRDSGRGLSLPIDYVALLREGHLGLAGMRERAEHISGRLEFSTIPEGGTRVMLVVPLNNGERDNRDEA